MRQEPDADARHEAEPGHVPEPGSEWPYASLLIFGFFGTDTVEGKRLAWRTTLFLVMFVVSVLGLTGGYESAFPDLLWVVGIPGSVAGIWWSYARYLGALDELSRTIQLRAFGVAYGAAMTLMAVAVAVAWIPGEPAAPAPLVGLPVFAEGARGLALAYFARRYG